MRKITFSHFYHKMPGLVFKNKSYLMGVQKVELEHLPADFIRYDTTYGANGGEQQYPLPKKGAYLILFIYTEENQLWTTVRRHTPMKESYYRSIVGQEVLIEVMAEGYTQYQKHL